MLMSDICTQSDLQRVLDRIAALEYRIASLERKNDIALKISDLEQSILNLNGDKERLEMRVQQLEME